MGRGVTGKLVIPADRVRGTVSLTKRISARIDRDPIILSHHPLCGRFEDHMFKVRGRYVCVGCVTVYPSAVATAAALVLVDLGSFWITVTIALSLFAINLLRFMVKDKRLRVLFNIVLGASVGAALFSAVYSPDDLRLVVVGAGLSMAVAFSYLKGRRVFTTCRSCDRHNEWPSCGFPSQVKAEGQSRPELLTGGR
jgi:hypothetical protein